MSIFAWISACVFAVVAGLALEDGKPGMALTCALGSIAFLLAGIADQIRELRKP